MPMSASRPPDDGVLHPRNRHQGRYDMPRLVAAYPGLRRHLIRDPLGNETIDFADAKAVTTLNAALLRDWYGIGGWQLPEGCLCPPIPGRADYIHYAADLLAADRGGTVPRGLDVRVLDIGCGASVVYPLVGHGEYGWRFVGSESDARSLAAARRNLAANPACAAAIEVRQQADPALIFQGVVGPDERFDLTLCNPPFHASAAEAEAGSRRKWRQLGLAPAGKAPAGKGKARAPRLNFGGLAHELWCPGGEVGFIGRMIAESATLGGRCRWFTSLLAKAEHLERIKILSRQAKCRDVRIIPMGQGQKTGRIVAWSFLSAEQRA